MDSDLKMISYKLEYSKKKVLIRDLTYMTYPTVCV